MGPNLTSCLGLSLSLVFAFSCGSVKTHAPSTPRDSLPEEDLSAWPTPNGYAWNGSWQPQTTDFPLAGLLDDEYGDGHDGTPVLPPGRWDWNDADNDLANWRNFASTIGTFAKLTDVDGRHFAGSSRGRRPPSTTCKPRLGSAPTSSVAAVGAMLCGLIRVPIA